MIDKVLAKVKLTRRGWAIMVYLLSVLALALGSFIYTGYAVSQEERKWCGLLETIDIVNHSVPPGTTNTRLIALEIHNLVVTYGCTLKDVPQ